MDEFCIVMKAGEPIFFYKKISWLSYKSSDLDMKFAPLSIHD